MTRDSRGEVVRRAIAYTTLAIASFAVAIFLAVIIKEALGLSDLAERAWPRHMQDEVLREIRGENAEIIAGLVVDLADPSISISRRRLKEAQLKAAEERLTWAEDYLQLGHDPDLATRRGVLNE